MRTFKLFLAVLVFQSLTGAPVLASTQKKVSTKRVMAELELDAKVKPTLRGLLQKITPMLQGKSRRYYDQNIPMSQMNDPVDIKYSEKEIVIKVQGRTTRVTFPGKKNNFASVNGIPLSEGDLEEFHLALRKLRGLYSNNDQLSPSLLGLFVDQAHAAIPWTGILIGAGVALLGLFVYKGMKSMSNTTHTVNVNGPADPIVVDVDVPTDYELEIPVSGRIETDPIDIDDVLDDVTPGVGTRSTGVLR